MIHCTKKNVQHTLIVPKVIKVYIQQQQWFYLRPSLVLPFFFFAFVFSSPVTLLLSAKG